METALLIRVRAPVICSPVIGERIRRAFLSPLHLRVQRRFLLGTRRERDKAKVKSQEGPGRLENTERNCFLVLLHGERVDMRAMALTVLRSRSRVRILEIRITDPIHDRDDISFL